MEHELILHHYWHSPFSARARQFLGLKGVSWRSVEMPNMMPKPELVSLTGGYRRAPVLQIGSDLYCDTWLILRELERRFGERPLVKTGAEYAVSYWLDRANFVPTVSLLFGSLKDVLPAEFIQDREAMFMDGSLSFETAKARLPKLTDQWRSLIAQFALWLQDGRSFLAGKEPSALDPICAMYVKMIRQWLPAVAGPVLSEFDCVALWCERVDALGEGSFAPMSYADAFAVARQSQPGPSRHFNEAPGTVSVFANDYAPEPVRGALVYCDAHEVAVRRHTTNLGDIVVHFPRAGYTVTQRANRQEAPT